ncbi:unnamed protein product, partial [Trichogramma brassicae]
MQRASSGGQVAAATTASAAISVGVTGGVAAATGAGGGVGGVGGGAAAIAATAAAAAAALMGPVTQHPSQMQGLGPLQGPPRSCKISPIKNADEAADHVMQTVRVVKAKEFVDKLRESAYGIQTLDAGRRQTAAENRARTLIVAEESSDARDIYRANVSLINYNFWKKEVSNSLCVGCGGHIHDQYILMVSPDLKWHAACLKCAACQQFLDESCTCFVRDGKTYCKNDYVRLFGTKCEKCRQSFKKNDFVMRAATKIYHMGCFCCVACGRPLTTGDEYALRANGLYCRDDHCTLAGDKSGCQEPILASGGAAAPHHHHGGHHHHGHHHHHHHGGGGGPLGISNENNNNANLTNNNHHLHQNDASLSGMRFALEFRIRVGLAQDRRRRRWRRRRQQRRRRRRRRRRTRRQPQGQRRRCRLRRQAHPGAHRPEREAAAHAAQLLLGESATRRPHEGATGRDDGPQSASDTRLVPEQALQGQEEDDRPQAADAAGEGRQEAGLRRHARHTHGGEQPGAPREPDRYAARGAGLPAALEGPVGLCPAHGSRAAGPERAALSPLGLADARLRSARRRWRPGTATAARHVRRRWSDGWWRRRRSLGSARAPDASERARARHGPAPGQHRQLRDLSRERQRLAAARQRQSVVRAHVRHRVKRRGRRMS